MIQFTIYGEPIAQGRPRASTINGNVKMYDPEKSRDYKDYVRLAAREFSPASLLESALGIQVIVYRSMPKKYSNSKVKSQQAEDGLILPTTKPDADNYLKGIKDALKSVIWKDDSQIVDAMVRKRYSLKPRIEVSIWEINYEI